MEVGRTLLQRDRHDAGALAENKRLRQNLLSDQASVIANWVKIYNLRKAQYVAGHHYVSSTEDYKQQVLDELQGDVKKFHPIG